MEHTYLGQDGRFRTDNQYPEFCWTELCVNSICHRDYSILGTDIQVKIFDDHITVESPGIFPGLVRPANIRHTHFSRNPKIAAYMHEYKLVKEYGEGVDRMHRELEEAGNPAPEFKQQDFMVLATIRQHGSEVKFNVGNGTLNGTLNDILKRLNPTQEKVYGYIKANPGVQAKHIIADLKMQRDTLNKVLRTLTDLRLIEHKDSKKTGGYYPLP